MQSEYGCEPVTRDERRIVAYRAHYVRKNGGLACAAGCEICEQSFKDRAATKQASRYPVLASDLTSQPESNKEEEDGTA